VEWLESIPREEQFTSAVVIGELYKGACRSAARERHLANIEIRVLPAVTVLPYDSATARTFGEISARLEVAGAMLADADLQIASTAIHHDLTLVTGNLRHFERVPGIRLDRILAENRKSR
jgi:predicted nucleic acid-binding protein